MLRLARGRPRTAQSLKGETRDDPTYHLRKTADERRAFFDSLTPARQRAERERIRALLDKERNRATLSPLALICWRAYGILPDWIDEQEVLPRESAS